MSYRKSVLIAAAVTFLVFMLSPQVALSQETASAQESYERGGMLGTGMVFGLKLGGGFGQLSSEFGSTFVGEFELGYNLPVLDRSIGLFSSVSYAGPTTTGEGEADPRLPGAGVMSYEITQQQLVLTLGVIYRIPVPMPMFRPYIAAGWRAYFMRSEITADVGGEAYGANEETSASYGGAYGALGGELHFGDAGAVLLELQYGWAAIDNYVLRNTNVGSLNVALGYRFFL